jgi:hypothetical protein
VPVRALVSMFSGGAQLQAAGREFQLSAISVPDMIARTRDSFFSSLERGAESWKLKAVLDCLRLDISIVDISTFEA